MRARWSRFRHRLKEQFPQLTPEHTSFRWLVLAAVMIATFMAVLDATIVNVALSKLMAAFGVSVDRVEWVLTAYLLVFGVMLPTSGWLADRIGYKLVFTIGLVIFTVASFLCSLAWSLNALIAFRVLQGSGSGILMPVGMAIIAREFPPEKRGVALGFWTVAASASVSLGPSIGGYLIDRFSWHAVFDVNVPIGIFGVGAALVILREYRSPEKRAFDLFGFLTLATFLTALLLALANGNSAWNTGGWHSGFILSCFAIAAVALIAFFIVELNVARPLIELDLFRDRNFSVGNLIAFLFGFGMFGSTFVLPIYLQNSLGYTPLQAGLVFLPVGALQAIAAPLAGVFSDRVTPRVPIVAGLVLMAWTFYEFGTLSLYSERREILVPLLVRGVAMGILLAPLTMAAIREIPNRRMAQASGLLNVIRQLGGSFGVATLGSILTRRTIYHTARFGEQIDPNSDAFRTTMLRLQGFAQHTTGGTRAEAAAKAQADIGGFVANQGFIRAVDDVFLAAGAAVLIGVIPVVLLRTRRRGERGR